MAQSPSWGFSSLVGCARISHMARELGGGLSGPVCVRDVGVPQISGQRHRVARHVVGCPWATCQRPYRNAVTQSVSPRPGDARVLPQLKGSAQRAASPIDHGIIECPAGGGDTDMVIIARSGMAPLKVALQGTNGTGMEGHQSARAARGQPHDQTVRGSVVSPQAHRFRDT